MIYKKGLYKQYKENRKNNQLITVLIICIIIKTINNSVRHNTLKETIREMNLFVDPELAFRKYKPCIVDWKRIDTPVRKMYRLILNPTLKVWNYHLLEEIGYDYESNRRKLLNLFRRWQLFTGPVVPDSIPIGVCKKCSYQIYEDDLV